MYLSRLILNPRNRRVREDLSDCQELHRTVMRAFPDQTVERARDQFEILHRADLDARSGRVMLLVQSAIQPDWSHLPQGYLVAMTDNPACKYIGTAYDGIEVGQHLIFRLRANPTKRLFVPDDPRMHGKRVELRTEQEQIAWMQRRGERGGFDLVHVRAAPDVPDIRVTTGDRFHGRREGARLTFGSVLFEGTLRVTEKQTFQQTLRDGIGSGKAYGFGLLSIGPHRG